MPFTDYLNTALQDHVWVQDTSFTPPASIYLSAYTDAPTELGTDGTEATGGSYARQAVTFAFSTTTGKVVNDGAISFTAMPACVVVALALHDDDTAGNMLAFGVLDEAVILSDGDPLTLADGLLGVIL